MAGIDLGDLSVLSHLLFTYILKLSLCEERWVRNNVNIIFHSFVHVLFVSQCWDRSVHASAVSESCAVQAGSCEPCMSVGCLQYSKSEGRHPGKSTH